MTFQEFHNVRVKHVWDYLDGKQLSGQEKIVEEKVAEYFSKVFKVYRQVKSDCGKYRCDIIMYHNDPKSLQTPFIIELKKGNIKQGATLGEWCTQSSNYSLATWHKGKKAVVLLYPQISGLYFEEGCLVKPHDVCVSDHHNINSFLFGAFGIGELRKFYHHEKKGYAIIVNNKTIWKSQTPYELNNKNIPK